MTEAGLVLEGGATRGVFTSGALDYLMEKDLYFSYVVGVSAGSCNGCSTCAVACIHPHRRDINNELIRFISYLFLYTAKYGRKNGKLRYR